MGRSHEFYTRLLTAMRAVRVKADNIGVDLPTARMMAYEAWVATDRQSESQILKDARNALNNLILAEIGDDEGMSIKKRGWFIDISAALSPNTAQGDE